MIGTPCPLRKRLIRSEAMDMRTTPRQQELIELARTLARERFEQRAPRLSGSRPAANSS